MILYVLCNVEMTADTFDSAKGASGTNMTHYRQAAILAVVNGLGTLFNPAVTGGAAAVPPAPARRCGAPSRPAAFDTIPASKRQKTSAILPVAPPMIPQLISMVERVCANARGGFQQAPPSAAPPQAAEEVSEDDNAVVVVKTAVLHLLRRADDVSVEIVLEECGRHTSEDHPVSRQQCMFVLLQMMDQGRIMLNRERTVVHRVWN